MATLYGLSQAFTVCHLLQLPLNAMSHKRGSPSRFTDGKRGRSSLQSHKAANVPSWTGSLSLMGLLVRAAAFILRDERLWGPCCPYFPIQGSGRAAMCCRVGTRCTWGTSLNLSQICPGCLVFLVRCSQCWVWGGDSSKVPDENAPRLSQFGDRK